MRGDRMFEMIGFQVAKLYLILGICIVFEKKQTPQLRTLAAYGVYLAAACFIDTLAFPVFVKYCTALPARTALSWETGEEAVCRFSDSGNESAV